MKRTSKFPRSPAFRQSHAAITADGTCDPDPALIIGLCLAFWRKGGVSAVPQMLMQMLTKLAACDTASATTFSMITRRTSRAGEQLELDFGEDAPPVPVTNPPTVCLANDAAQQSAPRIWKSIARAGLGKAGP